MKKLIFYSVAIGTALVAMSIVYSAEPRVIGKCNKPLDMVVLDGTIREYSPVIGEKELYTLTKKAEKEWEDKVGIDMFNILPNDSTLSRSGLISSLILKNRDNTIFTADQEQMDGQTNTHVENGIVVYSHIDIYNDSPLTIYQIILHEMGHARGLMGHSDQENDVMFAYVNGTNNLTAHDVQLMKDYCEIK